MFLFNSIFALDLLMLIHHIAVKQLTALFVSFTVIEECRRGGSKVSRDPLLAIFISKPFMARKKWNSLSEKPLILCNNEEVLKTSKL